MSELRATTPCSIIYQSTYPSIYLSFPFCCSLSDASISARPAKLVLDLKNIDMIALEILLGSKACSKSQAWKS